MPKPIEPPPGMVYIPPGPFLMGCADDETAIDPEYPDTDYLASARPQRTVSLPGFYMDVFPVTNRQYKEFIEDTGYHIPRPREDMSEFAGYWNAETQSYPEGLDDYPVVYVTYYDALAYCDWMGKRLPTEAEWEKAARGTDGRPFPWGWDRELEERSNVILDVDRPLPQSVKLALRPVDAFPNGVSPYGCFDMMGNAEEWCADWFDAGYYVRMPASSPRGPRKPGRERCRVQRGCGVGGGYAFHVAARSGGLPWIGSGLSGFRCALSIGDQPFTERLSRVIPD